MTIYSALPVVRTKIITPRRRTEILSRPRLLSILDEILELKLLIVSAPAGYGKTSLLIDFAYHSQLPICWYSVDSLDSDPKRFIAHFIGAISNIFPAFGEASHAALTNLDQDSMELEPLITAIINDIFENITEHFVFVLDDYHFVRESKLIDEFINFLVLGMSENCHLVIASRTLLTLPDLSIMVARSQVGGLSYEELSFAPEEIKQLYAVNYHQTITEQAALELVEQTEGWITGLLLTARLSQKETANRLRLARVSGIGIYEYLARQVLQQQPDDLVLFLKRTSLLEEFDAQMCMRIFSAVPGIDPENWQEKIDLLLRENLFVLPVDDETLHLRYHHLFQDYLQTCMRNERPEESRLIELELVKYCEERREWERAYAILSRIGNESQVTETIIKAAPSMILGGRLTSLSSWLESITEKERNASPEILSIRGTISMLKGENSTSLDFLNKAVEGFRNSSDQNELARALTRRSTLFRIIGSYQQAITDAQEAISICSHLAGAIRLEAEAQRAHGVACFQAGELKKALASLSIALERYTLIAEEMDAAKVMLDLGLVYMTLGQMDEAEVTYLKSLNFWKKTHNYLWQAHLLNNLGMVQHHYGDHEKAVISFENAITCARMATNPRVEGYLFVSLGDLYRDIGAFIEARKAYKLAQQTLMSINDQALKVFLLLSNASLERMDGNFQVASAMLADARQNAEMGGSRYEMALCGLEQAILDFRAGDPSEARPKLESLRSFFQKEGFHQEALRAHYFLLLVSLILQPEEGTISQMVGLIGSSLSGKDRSFFIHFCMETIDHLSDFLFHHQLEKIQTLLQILQSFRAEQTALRKKIRRHSITVQFALPKYVIRAFGKSQVRIGDHTISLSDWKTKSVRDVFFYILLHDEGVLKEDIGDALWPEVTEDVQKIRFKNSIYRLRHALGSEVIDYADDVYRFNRQMEYDFDVENFLQQVQMAREAAEATEKIHHLCEAVSCYKGILLPKMDYEWVLALREQMHRTFMTAILDLLALLMDIHQVQLAIHYADMALEKDPGCEEACRVAMQASAKIGDRAAVSRYYERCREYLSGELDVDPAPQTTQIFEQLTK